MNEPIIADTKPIILELDAGDYWWRSCGMSKNQPFCNGAHKKTDFKPTKLTLDKKQKVALCACKYSKNAPFCDGTHKHLTTEKVLMTTATSQPQSITNQGKTNRLKSFLARLLRKSPFMPNR